MLCPLRHKIYTNIQFLPHKIRNFVKSGVQFQVITQPWLMA